MVLQTHSWAVWLWAAQLVAPIFGLLYLGIRRMHEIPLRSWTVPVAIVCASWIFIVIASLCLSRSRAAIRRNALQILLAYGATLFALVVSDVALTISGLVPTIETQRQKSLLYRPSVSGRSRLVPNHQVVVDGKTHLMVNSRGYRDEDFTATPAIGVTRVLVFGGSQVFDYDNPGISWPKKAGRIASNRQRPIECLNLATPGHCSSDSIGTFLTDAWRYKPDYVILCHGWNDLKYLYKLGAKESYRDLTRPVTRLWWLDPKGLDRLMCISAIHRIARISVYNVFSGEEGEPPRELIGQANEPGLNQFRLNLKVFCDLARNIGATPILCKQARLPIPDLPKSEYRKIRLSYVGMPYTNILRAFGEIDRILVEVAVEKQLLVIDMDAPMSGQTEFFRDHIHFSRQGGEMAAKVFADGLRSVLAGDGG